MFKSSSTSLILLGILAVIVGIVAIAWPGVTILALVILFAIYAFTDGGLQAARAFSSGSAGPVFGHLLLGLIDLAAGVVALAWPAPTAFVLVIVVAAWALAGGVAEFFAGFQSGEAAGTRALFILSGLVSVAFGVLLFARPGVGAVTLALLFGLYSMIYVGRAAPGRGGVGTDLDQPRRRTQARLRADPGHQGARRSAARAGHALRRAGPA
jgi:uncharacterized membrane protein HdeD (DUF308 family)